MRRFLSGGSVAERVLAFEKSPTVFGLGSPAAPVVSGGDGRERRIPITVQPPPPPPTLPFSSAAPEAAAAATQLETSAWKQPSRDIQVGKKERKKERPALEPTTPTLNQIPNYP